VLLLLSSCPRTITRIQRAAAATAAAKTAAIKCLLRLVNISRLLISCITCSDQFSVWTAIALDSRAQHS
jgi:hypothetical protein